MTIAAQLLQVEARERKQGRLGARKKGREDEQQRLETQGDNHSRF
jgi:hypothetical protein